MQKIAGLALCLAACVAFGADEKLLQDAKRAQPAVVQTLKDLVAIESGSTNVKGLLRMADYVEARLKALGRKAAAIYAELDERPLGLTPMTGGATDAGYASRSGKAVVLESFGLAGFGYHARDEYVELDSIVPRLYLMSRLLRAIAK